MERSSETHTYGAQCLGRHRAPIKIGHPQRRPSNGPPLQTNPSPRVERIGSGPIYSDWLHMLSHRRPCQSPPPRRRRLPPRPSAVPREGTCGTPTGQGPRRASPLHATGAPWGGRSANRRTCATTPGARRCRRTRCGATHPTWHSARKAPVPIVKPNPRAVTPERRPGPC